MTKKDLALNYFLGRDSFEKLNCVQAVVKVFNEEDNIASYAGLGSGRAPDGLCGAIYAATILANNKDKTLSKLKQKLGFVSCRELRVNKVSCLKCVADSVEVLLEDKPDPGV